MSLVIDSIARFVMTTGEFGWVALFIFILGCAAGLFWPRWRHAVIPPQPVQPLPVQQVFHFGNLVPGAEGVVNSTTIDRIEAITQAEYEALTVPDERTIYLTH